MMKTKDNDLRLLEERLSSTTRYGSSEDEEDELAALMIRREPTCSTKWSDTLLKSRTFINRCLHFMALRAARHPWWWVVGIIIFALTIAVLGLSTNFEVVVDGNELWPPTNSLSRQHDAWIQHYSGFPERPGIMLLTIHANGANVLEEREGILRVFEAIAEVERTPGYDVICSNDREEEEEEEANTNTNTNATVATNKSTNTTTTKNTTNNATNHALCPVQAVTNFWNNNLTLFEDQAFSDNETASALSEAYFLASHALVGDTLEGILGHPETSAGNNEAIESALAFKVTMFSPSGDSAATKEMQLHAIDRILSLRNRWAEQQVPYHVEVYVHSALDGEFNRGVEKDLPLMPAAFMIMSLFTCMVFARWDDKVQSQSLVGLGAVVTVLLSIMTGYGLLFVIGVPFTPASQLVVFVMFGIGVDDAFIISSSYAHTNTKTSPEARIQDTIDDVGLSIFLTTLTSTTAFALGCLSSIPGITWLCMYAAPTIMIDFLYMITFFVALIVIDERRIENGRFDVLVCVKAKKEDEAQQGTPVEQEPRLPFSERVMVLVGNNLMRPCVKLFVIVAFTSLLGASIYGATQLQLELQVTDLLPKDSYFIPFIETQEEYTSHNVAAYIYIRYVDQSDPQIRQAMNNYLEDLLESEALTARPSRFWVDDFEVYLQSLVNAKHMTFEEQFDLFLDEPTYHELYRDHIVRDANGNITASRIPFSMDIDLNDSPALVAQLALLREVASRQPVNQGDDGAFFTFAPDYFIWEFHSVANEELVLTAITGIISVTVIGLFFVPHWTATLFVFPSIVTLYVDLLGYLHFVGIAINPLSYITLVISIGLMVDFLMHALIRYYELHGLREEKVKETLRTIGAPILTGGFTTFLGTIPLALSNALVFTTLFKAFVGLVLLGLSYGLILLPTVLSLVGPDDSANRLEEALIKRIQSMEQSLKHDMEDLRAKHIDVEKGVTSQITSAGGVSFVEQIKPSHTGSVKDLIEPAINDIQPVLLQVASEAAKEAVERALVELFDTMASRRESTSSEKTEITDLLYEVFETERNDDGEIEC